MWCGEASRIYDKKKHLIKRDSIACSKYDKRSMLNSQYNLLFLLFLFCWGGLYDHSMSITIFILIMNKMFIHALTFMRKVAMSLIWVRQPFFTNRKFRILGEMGYIKYDI